MAKNDQKTQSFGDAIGELEGILQRIEGEDIDIDELAGELKRAARLLDLCRGKIRKAEVEVNQIVENLEKADGAGGEATGDASGEDE